MNRPIKHQKQHGPECALVSIAMLAGKPIELIRRRALGIAQVARWEDTLNDHVRFWQAIIYLVQFYNLQNLYCTAGLMPGFAAVATHPVTPNCPKLMGRGQLVYQHIMGAHSVVVDNGIVFDGNLDGPMPLAQYWADIVIAQYGATRFWTKMEIGE